ncbi:MAG: hypothetical protein HKN59_07255 [Gammaproteobacteria bacterium]|nr:hypothetical protein [Gammaproteobacteria bacterium]
MSKTTNTPGGAAMTPLDVDARKMISVLFFSLVAFEVFFVLADAIINVERLTDLGPIRRFFNITREDGVASWFAVTQTWMLGLTATFLFVVMRANGAERWRRVGWAIIAVFLLYMAMDDGSKFHERVGSAVKELIKGDDDDSRQIGFFPSYTWQLVFLPIFGSFGLFILWFLNKELQVARDKLMVVAAVGLLVLAVVADFFEGLDMDHPINLHGWIKQTWDLSTYQVRHYSKSIEEFMEMLSMTFLWIVFLRHLTQISPSIDLRFRNVPTG